MAMTKSQAAQAAKTKAHKRKASQDLRGKPSTTKIKLNVGHKPAENAPEKVEKVVHASQSSSQRPLSIKGKGKEPSTPAPKPTELAAQIVVSSRGRGLGWRRTGLTFRVK